jgi:hypothetical protein
MTKLASKDIAVLDACQFMAAIEKRVVHPGSRASCEFPLRRAAITASSRALLMPRLARVGPDLGCVVVAGTKPR